MNPEQDMIGSIRTVKMSLVQCQKLFSIGRITLKNRPRRPVAPGGQELCLVERINIRRAAQNRNRVLLIDLTKPFIKAFTDNLRLPEPQYNPAPCLGVGIRRLA